MNAYDSAAAGNEDLNPALQKAINTQRRTLLRQLENWLETPMMVLGFVWLALLVLEFIWGLSRLLETFMVLIWIVFVFDFLVKFILATHKLKYLKSNWLTALALLLPALRVFRIVRVVCLLRAARAVRGSRLVRVLSDLSSKTWTGEHRDKGVFNMSTKGSGARYDAEFKQEAVRLLLTSGKTITQLACELGVSSWSLSRWKQDYLKAK
ncbi:MAG: transposase [Armatimonadota bacterium]|nr:transposase [Armatimonadota bacterium]